MRYSFHGKVRATGQTVDGFVEAPNSTAAIDRLADRGIIGVYSVRPAPKPPEEEKPAAQLPPPPPPPAPAPVKSDSEVVFTTLVDKLGTLLTQVERLLEKPPQQVIYQTHNTTAAPIREVSQRFRRPHPNMSSNSTLRDIFQTNLDLRQSLEKLASNSSTTKAMSDGAKTVADAANRLTQAAVDAAANKEMAAGKNLEKVEEEADAEHHAPANGRETAAREAKGHGLVTAQPAA